MTPTKVIGDYSAANSIDGAAHYLLIQPGSSSTAYSKINRNTFLGVTGQPMDISTTQTVGGKVFSNTNSMTIKDANLTLQDDGDTTKQVQFQLSGITTATTRTLTVPNVSGTIVTDNSTVTLTNKTLTSPAITGGTIDQSTITVDSIAGHTTANTGTIYGLSITTGTIGTTGLAGNAVQASQIATNAIKLGYTKLTAGNGTVTSATYAVFATNNLSNTFTMPAGSRDVKVTVCGSFDGATSGNGYSIAVFEGSTNLGSISWTQPVNAYAVPVTLIVEVPSPSIGSHTYTLQGGGGGGQLTLLSGVGTSPGSSGPATMLVELI